MSRGDLLGEVLGAGEVEDGRLRVGAGGDDRRPELLAVGERDPDDPAVADVDRGDLGVGADLGAGRLGRAGDRLADRAHAADHLAPSARDAVDLAERVVEQVVRGARRARPGPDADHAGRGDRALEPIVLEPVVEQVGDRHREDADQVVDVAAAEPGGARRPRAAATAGRRGGASRAPGARAASSAAGTRRCGRAGPRSPRRPRRRASRTLAIEAAVRAGSLKKKIGPSAVSAA